MRGWLQMVNVLYVVIMRLNGRP